MKIIRTILLLVILANIVLLLNVALQCGASISDVFKNWETWVCLGIVAIPHIGGIALYFYTRKKHDTFSVIKMCTLNGLMIGVMLPVIFQLYFHISHFGGTWLWIIALSVIYYGIPLIVLSCLAGSVIGLIIKKLKNSLNQRLHSIAGSARSE